MKTPPFLLFAALLFWGWQSGFIVVGTILGTALEGARLIRLRWDLTEEDFRRVWNLCMLLALGLIVYTFSTGGTGGGPKGLLPDSAAEATRNIGVSATIFLRWLPRRCFCSSRRKDSVNVKRFLWRPFHSLPAGERTPPRRNKA